MWDYTNTVIYHIINYLSLENNGFWNIQDNIKNNGNENLKEPDF